MGCSSWAVRGQRTGSGEGTRALGLGTEQAVGIPVSFFEALFIRRGPHVTGTILDGSRPKKH